MQVLNSICTALQGTHAHWNPCSWLQQRLNQIWSTLWSSTLTCYTNVKHGYFSYCTLPVSSNQPGHPPLTCPNSKAFLPTQLPLTGCFFLLLLFTSFCVNSRDHCVWKYIWPCHVFPGINIRLQTCKISLPSITMGERHFNTKETATVLC